MTNIHKVMVIKSDSEREEDESSSKNECHLCGKVFKSIGLQGMQKCTDCTILKVIFAINQCTKNI